MSPIRSCAACGAHLVPEDRCCRGGEAAPAADAATTTASARSNTQSEETCLVYDWLFRQPNGARARLADLIIERRAREPAEIRAALRAFVRAEHPSRWLHALLLDMALDRVDWDQLVEDYLERERRDAAEDRAEGGEP